MSASGKDANRLLPSSTKICPPDLSKIFRRPRLQEILEKNEDKKLVLIIGQAAQGKSTVAASYFQNSSRPSAWVNLGREDSDPVNFFYLLIQAVQRTFPKRDLGPLLSIPSQSVGPREGLFLYREWALALFNTINVPFQIFLDSLDRLAPDADTFRFLQILSEEMPPSIRLFLLSREYPPLAVEFQQRKMGRQALLLKNEDLAFTPLEIKQYFKELHSLSLNAEQVERVYKATEGWIGGITLLSEILNNLPRGTINEYLGDKLPNRFHHETFQYFSREAFSAITPSHQSFLIRSSLLDPLEPGILQDLFPEEDGQAFLKELTRKNLFVQAFPDPAKGMIFRYHQLFKDFLGALLRSQCSAEEIQKLLTRAGAHYEKERDLEKAIRYYLEARSYSKASLQVKHIGLELVKKARMADLSHWLQKLPKPIIQSDPWLLLFGTLPNRFFTLEENIRTLKEAVSLFKDRGDRSGLLLGMALLIEAEFILGIYRPESIQEAEERLQASTEDPFLYERAFLWLQIGLVHSIRGNPRQGYWACQKAYLLAHQAGDNLLQTYAVAHAVVSLSILGEFRQAERLLNELNSASWNIPSAEIRFYSTISRIIYLIFKGEAGAALGLCNTLEEDMEKQGLTYLYPYVLFHKQVSLVYAQEHQQAGQIGDQLMNLALATNNGFLKGIIFFYSGLSAYWSDRRSEARGLIDQSLTFFESGPSRSDLHRVGARLARALLNNRPQARASAIKEIREILSYLESIQSILMGTECHLALGLLYYDQGQKEKARQHLQAGLKQAQQRNYRHFMIISPPDTVRACLLAQECFEAGNDTAAFASLLVIQKFGPSALGELEKLSQHPNPQVGRKALEIRRSIHRSQAPFLRIETFGGLHLYFENRMMPEAAWDRSQPRQLLIAILSQKNEKVPKEVLIEALWPEEQPETGEKNFKTALQRLRKSLESEISPVFGSSYLHLHHNLVFLDEDLCRVDARQFRALANEGREKEKRGDLPGALDCFTRAAELYRGDFIPEERYDPWTERHRQDLRNIYIEILTHSARYHDQSGAFKKAVYCLKQVLDTDPLLEEAYRSLMTLYAEKNLFNEALRVFEACRKAFKDELDTAPDPVTVALYRGIKERTHKF